MPAMWDRLNTSSPSPIATAPARPKPLPPPPPAFAVQDQQQRHAPQKVPPPRTSSRAAPFHHHYRQISTPSLDNGSQQQQPLGQHQHQQQQQRRHASTSKTPTTDGAAHDRFSSSPYPVTGGLQGLGIDGVDARHFSTFRVQIPIPSSHLPPSPEELSPDEATTTTSIRGAPALRLVTRHSSVRTAKWRPTSSIYSQSSPVDSEFANVAPRNHFGPGVEEISPPSSPEHNASGNGRDVSPIDEVPNMSHLENAQAAQGRPPSQQRSNIPMMRRQRRHDQEASATAIRESKSIERIRDRHDDAGTPEPPNATTGRAVFKLAQGKEMRWDSMTGEPTLGPGGRSGQVKPQEYAQGLTGSSAPVGPAQSALERLRHAQQSFGDRVRKIRTGGDGAAADTPVDGPAEQLTETMATTAPEHIMEETATSAEATPPPPPVPRHGSNPATMPGPAATVPDAAPSAKLQQHSGAQKRPEWKGGSGRTTLVDPVQDAPSIAPLNIPRKSSKRAAARGVAANGSTPLSPISPSGSETSSRGGPTVRKVVPSSQHSKTDNIKQGSTGGVPSPLASPATLPAAAAQAYPSPPNTGSPIPPSNAKEPLLMDHQLQSLSPAPNSSSAASDAEKATRRKPAPHSSNNEQSPPSSNNNNNAHHHKFHPSTASSVYSQYDAKNTTAPPPNVTPNATPKITGDDNWVQPSSRFSVTTYATSTHGSPRPSVDDVPPIPAPPQGHQAQTPVMDRKRPAGRGYHGEHGSPLSSHPVGTVNDPVVISLNPVYMSSPFGVSTRERVTKVAPSAVDRLPAHMRTAAAVGSRTNTMMSSDSRSSVMSTSKALPPAPPELSTMNANDRVAHLNARLEGLANRRININKSIKQMTELMPTDNLLASDAVVRKREMEKLKVEGLKVELSEVQREEYELGLKLHRAYKRLDRDAQYEPTGLWVRRCTS